jgi:hypothetical protein
MCTTGITIRSAPLHAPSYWPSAPPSAGNSSRDEPNILSSPAKSCAPDLFLDDDNKSYSLKSLANFSIPGIWGLPPPAQVAVSIPGGHCLVTPAWARDWQHNAALGKQQPKTCAGNPCMTHALLATSKLDSLVQQPRVTAKDKRSMDVSLPRLRPGQHCLAVCCRRSLVLGAAHVMKSLGSELHERLAIGLGLWAMLLATVPLCAGL